MTRWRQAGSTLKPGQDHLPVRLPGVSRPAPGRCTRASRSWEQRNSANGYIFYGKGSELTGADRESQEISMLALHLLQSAVVHVNTLLVERVLADDGVAERPTTATGAA